MRAPTIILMYDSWDTTLDLIGEMTSREANLWLVDNHSPEDRTEEARKRFPTLRVIRSAHNGGWAAAYNSAMNLAASEGHDAVYLLNGDAVADPGAIDRAFDSLRTSGAAAIGSVILSMDGGTVEYDGHHHRYGSRPAAGFVDPNLRPASRIHGAAMAVSLTAYRQIGPFCEDYFLYHEETDWAVRALEQGFSLYVDGASHVRHMDGGSDQGANATYYRNRNRSIAFRRGISLTSRPMSGLSVLTAQVTDAKGRKGIARRASMQAAVDGAIGTIGPRPKRKMLWIAGAHAALSLLVLPYRVATRLGFTSDSAR